MSGDHEALNLGRKVVFVDTIEKYGPGKIPGIDRPDEVVETEPEVTYIKAGGAVGVPGLKGAIRAID